MQKDPRVAVMVVVVVSSGAAALALLVVKTDPLELALTAVAGALEPLYQATSLALQPLS